jgi:hypothetical protein
MSFAISIAVSGLASYAAGRAWGSEEWWRSAAPARAIGAGATLAVVSIAIVAVLPSTWHRAAFATLLLGIAAEYTGFALIDRRPGRIVLEAAWAAGTMAAAIAGLLGSPAWLAAGFIAHVGWDLMTTTASTALTRTPCRGGTRRHAWRTTFRWALQH